MKGLHQVVHRDEHAQGFMGLRQRKLRSAWEILCRFLQNSSVSCKSWFLLSLIGPLSTDTQKSLFSYSEFDPISDAPSRLTSSAFPAPTQQLLDDVYIYEDVRPLTSGLLSVTSLNETSH
jgi:hypothetical protein